MDASIIPSGTTVKAGTAIIGNGRVMKYASDHERAPAGKDLQFILTNYMLLVHRVLLMLVVQPIGHVFLGYA